MLSTIFGSKSDHPLADIKSVPALLEDLPKTDAHKTLTELTDLVEMLMAAADFRIDHQFAVLRLLDDTAQPYLRKLAREYFTPVEINKFTENRLWTVLNNWANQTSSAYVTLFAGCCNAEKGSGVIKGQLPLIAARCVNAIMWQIKMTSARYEPVDGQCWVNLLQVYKHAEQQQYLEEPVNLYPGLPGSTSVKSELGHVLVWFDSGLSILSPLFMHLAERLVEYARSTIDIRRELTQQSRIGIDLNQPGEPARINIGATTHPAMRFVAMPSMQALLEKLLEVLKKNVVPDDLGLGGNYSAQLAAEAVQNLLNYLAAPPVRRNARRSASITLTIVNGFDKVLERTSPLMGSEEKHLMRWVTDEISMGGFSTTLPAKGSESIGVGSLLGIQPESVPHWGVAVVRRLMRKNENNMNVGAQILANRVAPIALNYSGAGEVTEAGQPALWLYSKQDEAAGEVQLLMRADSFTPGRSLKVLLDGKEYLLMPLGLQERGLDHDLAKFRFVIQEKGGEVAY